MDEKIVFEPLHSGHLIHMYSVFSNDKHISKQDTNIIAGYFDRGWYGCGAFLNGEMLAYCFIKHPHNRPETLTQVKEKFRNQGIATALRNYTLEQRHLFNGNII